MLKIQADCTTKDYENVQLHSRRQNKPNQTQFKANSNPIQTQPVVSLSNLFKTCIAKRFQQNNQLSTIDNQWLCLRKSFESNAQVRRKKMVQNGTLSAHFGTFLVTFLHFLTLFDTFSHFFSYPFYLFPPSGLTEISLPVAVLETPYGADPRSLTPDPCP